MLPHRLRQQMSKAGTKYYHASVITRESVVINIQCFIQTA